METISGTAEAYSLLKDNKGVKGPYPFFGFIRSKIPFYKCPEDYKQKVPHKVALPTPLEYLHYSLDFLSENGINTVGDLVDYLNTMGYNKTLCSALYCLGVTFDTTGWKWASARPRSKVLIEVCVSGPVGEQDTELVFKDLITSTGSPCYTIYLAREVSCSAPKWMSEKQGYKFVPEETLFKSLPREAHGENSLYFGMEFEVITSLSLKHIQRVVCDVEPMQEPFFYFKHDGSVEFDYDEGDSVELVTVPCTARYLRKNLRTFFSKLDRLGLTGEFETNLTCGVHVHLSKEAFYSDFHRKKFITIWNQFERSSKDFVQKLGKRTFTSYCKNAEAHEGLTLSRRLSQSVYADSHSSAKYSASRETAKTVEVRIFKGEFSLDHILYCLDVSRAMFAYADKAPLSALRGLSFQSSFLSWLRSTPHFMSLKKELL